MLEKDVEKLETTPLRSVFASSDTKPDNKLAASAQSSSRKTHSPEEKPWPSLKIFDSFFPLIVIYAIAATLPVARWMLLQKEHVLLCMCSVAPLIPLVFLTTGVCTVIICFTFNYPKQNHALSHYVLDTLGTGFAGLSAYIVGIMIAPLVAGVIGFADAPVAGFIIVASFLPTMLYAGGVYETTLFIEQLSTQNISDVTFSSDFKFGLAFQGTKFVLYGILFLVCSLGNVKLYRYTAVHLAVNLVACLAMFAVFIFAAQDPFNTKLLVVDKFKGMGMAAVCNVFGVPEMSYRVVRKVMNDTMHATNSTLH
ncbi:hypothetical protein HK100_009641 [Physocladia obscura]|uniref:Uncharacterized protein n=1 Tax=Physocladia obscura TaxID=109957 RepID=A0AAD5XE53_9FUNG|nr:hypothetical protein HK100_009641 [Physocladia obscura]